MSVHALMCLSSGLAVCLLALALGVQSGREVFDGGVLVVALYDGLLVGLTCVFIFRRTPADVAREIDRGLELEGALFTAWEVEGRESASAIGRRLGSEVAGNASAQEMLRAIVPNVAPFLALPFIACALLFSVLDDVRNGARIEDLRSLTSQVEQGLASISEEGSRAATDGSAALAPEDHKKLRDLMDQAASLSKKLGEGSAEPQEFEELVRDLADLRAGAGDSEDLHRELDHTLNSLDALAMALDASEAGSGASAGQNVSEGEGISGSSGRGLAPGGEDGRMSRPENPSTAGVQRSEAGVIGRPIWPRAHESIVRRWVESTRTSRTPR
ncbi:MAG: hypothetical protein ACI8X5_003421 [Planctomycetota bacterium]|jgi:hypothetical protein